MPREAREIVLTLTPDEAAEITGAAGSGGHQELHRRLKAELANGNLQVSFSDAELGELIRYMTQYGSGGFQGRLKRAFIRSLRELLGI
jgi:hypothetical protein